MVKERKGPKGLKSVAEVLDGVKSEIGVKFKETASKVHIPFIVLICLPPLSTIPHILDQVAA